MNVTILYSGGLDSFIMHQYAIKQGYKPILVYVDLGHPYSTKEKKGETTVMVSPFHRLILALQ